MQFPYIKFQCESVPAFPTRKNIVRPVINIKLKFNGNEINHYALIDSGSDYCFFDAELGETMGIEIKNGKRLEFFGVTGEKQESFFHNISILVGGWEKECYCGFCYGLTKRMPYGILGQKGFFDLFKISMDYKKEQIELKPKE